jgi:hypothetical protein
MACFQRIARYIWGLPCQLYHLIQISDRGSTDQGFLQNALHESIRQIAAILRNKSKINDIMVANWFKSNVQRKDKENPLFKMICNTDGRVSISSLSPIVCDDFVVRLDGEIGYLLLTEKYLFLLERSDTDEHTFDIVKVFGTHQISLKVDQDTMKITIFMAKEITLECFCRTEQSAKQWETIWSMLRRGQSVTRSPSLHGYQEIQLQSLITELSKQESMSENENQTLFWTFVMLEEIGKMLNEEAPPQTGITLGTVGEELSIKLTENEGENIQCTIFRQVPVIHDNT